MTSIGFNGTIHLFGSSAGILFFFLTFLCHKVGRSAPRRPDRGVRFFAGGEGRKEKGVVGG